MIELGFQWCLRLPQSPRPDSPDSCLAGQSCLAASHPLLGLSDCISLTLTAHAQDKESQRNQGGKTPALCRGQSSERALLEKNRIGGRGGPCKMSCQFLYLEKQGCSS